MLLTPDIVRQKLSTIPPVLGEWFWSDDIADRIIVLKDKFQLYGEEWAKIANLLVRLEIKDLAWEDFKSELAKELVIPLATAEQITDEVKLQLLAPIAHDLAAYGIGVSEFGAIAAAQPLPVASEPSTVGPIPGTTQLPAFFSSGARPVTPAPTRQAPPPQAPAMPTPVVLRHEESTPQAAHPGFSIPMRFGAPVGNQISSTPSSSVPTPPRPARVELGKSAPRLDGAVPAPVRTQKETPLPRPSVDYAAIRQSVGGSISVAAPFETSSSDIPKPATAPMTPSPQHSTLPSAESLEVSIPTRDDQGASALSASQEPSGLINKLMSKVSPWHYARFSGGGKATSALETPSDATVVNYADVPPRAPASAPTPSAAAVPPPAPKPMPTDSFPQPPKPLV